MMKELGKKELLDILDAWRKFTLDRAWNEKYEQAYRQIKKLIEDENKSKVSKKEIYDFVDKEWEDCDYHNTLPESYEVKGMIVSFLESTGLRVEEE